MKLNRLLFVLLIGCLAVIVIGCSQGGKDKAADQPKNTEKVKETEDVKEKPAEPDMMSKAAKLSFYQYSGSISDEEFQIFVADPVKKKYPNISIEMVRNAADTTPEKLIATNSMPDIIYTGSGGAINIVDLESALDLNPLVKKYNMDLNAYHPVTFEMIEQYSDKGELLALPFAINFSVLYYNKDLFDKFGEVFPSDGLTWDEAIQLARKLTRSEDGIEYKGLEFDTGMGGVYRLGEQLELVLVDPNTSNALIDTDGWRKAVETFKQIKTIPGNMNDQPPIPSFMQARNAAMMAGFGARLGELEQLHNQGNPVNYDIATMPIFPETLNNAWKINVFLLMLSPNGKHQEQAFRVLELVMGEDVQTMVNKRGRMPGLVSKDMRATFGEELNSFVGKNANAVFQLDPAPYRFLSKYDNIVAGYIAAAMSRVINEGIDINTALREAEEITNQKIEEAKLLEK